MSDFVTLTCPNCGGKLEITKDIERFACGYWIFPIIGLLIAVIISHNFANYKYEKIKPLRKKIKEKQKEIERLKAKIMSS